jgi:shikimate kinase
MRPSESVDNLILVGFMGSGKSSVGREIARRSGRRFLDTDSIIRRKYAKSIPEIFANYGERRFRAEEHCCLQELQETKEIVLSTGGGIVVEAANRVLLRSLGIVVWLTASEEVIWQRVSRNTDRPLLQTENPRATIQSLLLQRNPIYGEVAHLTIETTGLTHREVADRVLEGVAGWLDS